MEQGTDITPVQEVIQNPPNTPAPQTSLLDNLATGLPEADLQAMGVDVVQDYEVDLASRSEWEKHRANWLKLFAGYREPKNFPFENCSNVHVPMMGVACLQFQARAYEALLPPKEYAKCFSTDGKTVDNAKRASKYLNWQLTEQMEEWEEDQDVLLLLLPLNGSAYKKTYYDPILKRPVSRVIGVQNFVTPYKCKRLEDAPRKTHVYELSLSEIKIRENNGVFLPGDIDRGDDNLHSPAPLLKIQSQKITGITEAGTDQNSQKADDTRKILEMHRGWDLNGDGILENYIITVDHESKKVKRIESRDYTDPVDKKEKVMEYFTNYTFIPNPESHYGFGFGHLLEGLNEAANTIVNELIDAGSLNNAPVGFINRRSGVKAGDIKTAPGKLNSVDINSDDIRKAIYFLEFQEPSEALFKLLGLLQGYGKEIATLTESMMGKLPPSDTTATTMLAVMEQGLKVFSTIHKRTHRAFKKELKKIARLNSLYLEETVYAMVQNSVSKEFQTLQSGRQDFADNVDVIPVSDPSITSRAEKMIKAKQEYEVGIGNPMIQNDPEAMYELTYSFYEAMEEDRIDRIVKKPKPPPPPPDLSQIEENALFLQEKYTKPLQHQDHIQHLQIMEEFLASPWIGQLTPQGKKLVQMHKEETLSFAYLAEKQKEQQLMQAEMQLQQLEAALGNQQRGMEGMAPSSTYLRGIEKIGTTR
jgi:chaperonin GroES